MSCVHCSFQNCVVCQGHRAGSACPFYNAGAKQHSYVVAIDIDGEYEPFTTVASNDQRAMELLEQLRGGGNSANLFAWLPTSRHYAAIA